MQSLPSPSRNVTCLPGAALQALLCQSQDWQRKPALLIELRGLGYMPTTKCVCTCECSKGGRSPVASQQARAEMRLGVGVSMQVRLLFSLLSKSHSNRNVSSLIVTSNGQRDCLPGGTTCGGVQISNIRRACEVVESFRSSPGFCRMQVSVALASHILELASPFATPPQGYCSRYLLLVKAYSRRETHP